MASRRALLALLALAPLPARPETGSGIPELIIIGSGVAGLTAACIAAESGLKGIVVLEKEPVIGGTSIRANGFWTVAGTELQKKLGIEDSDEAFFSDMRRIGGFVNSEPLVRTFIRENNAQYAWFLKNGIAPHAIVAASGVKRAHVFDIVRMMEFLRDRALALGVDIRTGARAVKLLRGKSGRIDAAEVLSAGATRVIRARRGVILATGGFSRNTSLITKYVPLLRKADVVAAEGATGDGLAMAAEFRAKVIDTEYIKASYGFIVRPSTMDDLSLVEYSGAIIVNRDAKRFVDESKPYKEIADEALRQRGPLTYLVFDEAIRRESMKQTPDSVLWAPIDRGRVPDYVIRAGTLAEAAAGAGLDPEALRASVERYNGFALAGKDPDFGRPAPLVPIKAPPYYIVPSRPAIIETYCGLAINERAQVLDQSGRPIPGLWAAGEVTGGIHGASFIMGSALAKAAAFGRVAARSVLAEEPR